MRALVCCLLMQSVAPCAGQVWCPPQARWIYDTGSPWSTWQTQFEYVGDTLVDGYTAQRISQEGLLTESFGNDTLVETSGPDIITRTVDGMVLRWLAQSLAWDTLYWFSAVPGDAWSPAWAFEEECEPAFRLLVLDTGSVSVDGVMLHTLTVQRMNGTEPVADPEIIAERIGTLSGYFEPIAGCAVIVECYCSFGCYSDQQISHPLSGEVCRITLGVEPDRVGHPPQIFPNPGSDQFTLSRMFPELSVIRVSDALGRPLHQESFIERTVTVHLAAVPQGVYLIALSGPSGQEESFRWVKQ